MKVSNNIDVAKIYQEQIKKAEAKSTDGAFRKMLQDSQPVEVPKESLPTQSSAPLNLTSLFPADKAVSADPTETIKFAAMTVASEPDIRSEKVDQIKKLIASGQYNIPAEKVAERLFSSGILNVSFEG